MAAIAEGERQLRNIEQAGHFVYRRYQLLAMMVLTIHLGNDSATLATSLEGFFGLVTLKIGI